MSKYAACPFGGGPDCMKHGGNGAEQHKMGGTIMQKHQEAMARGAQPKTEQAKEEHQKQEEARAETYDATPHPRDEKLTALSESRITSAKPLGEEKGVNPSWKVTLEDGGSGCMKPPPQFKADVYDGLSYADGAGAIPKDRGHISERAAHVAAISLGLENHVPETVVRNTHAGDMSVQSWQEGYAQAAKRGVGNYRAYIARVPAEHRDKVENKLKEIACMDFVINNNDRHFNNLVFNEDLSDVKAIDHGLSFGTGLQGHKNGIHNKLHAAGQELTVPSHMHERFKNQTFDQTKRQFEGSGLQDWQVAQVHLRMKYLAHLQDTHGHVPIEATRYACVRPKTANTDFESKTTSVSRYLASAGQPGWKRPNTSKFIEQHREYNNGKLPDKKEVETWAGRQMADQMRDAADKWEMPDQLYARFAKSYIEGDSGHDSIESRAELQQHAAFDIGTGHLNGGSDESRQKYWDSIPAWKSMDHWGGNKESAAPLRQAPDLPTRDSDTLDDSAELLDVGTRKPGKKTAKQPTQEADAATRTGSVQKPSTQEATRAVTAKAEDATVKELGSQDVTPMTRKPGTRKGLYLFDPHRTFPVDTVLRK